MLEEFYIIILILEKILILCIVVFGVMFFLNYVIKISQHNQEIKNKYKREKIEKDSNFEVKRCKEEYYSGNSDRIYIIDKKRKTYHCIVDPYTLNQLGFGFQDAPIPQTEDEDEKERIKKTKDESDKYFFSKKDYDIGERIKIYDLIFDIGKMIALIQKFKKEVFKLK